MKLTTALFVLATELVTASTLTREDANVGLYSFAGTLANQHFQV